MSCTYLLEIGCEEIPARFLAPLCDDLKQRFSTALDDNRLSLRVYVQWQPIADYPLKISGLAEHQPDLEQLIKGPPKEVAIDKSNTFTQAAFGFQKKQH